MASVNQFKTVLFIFSILLVMQTSACESRRQARLELENQNHNHRIVANEK